MNDSFKKHPHWAFVQEICKKLQSHGYKAWLAGGCVRDALRNVTPNDFDVATDASPDQVIDLFAKTIEVGKAFGVVRVVAPAGFDIEVATFRKDGPYSDGRRPDSVTQSTPEEDAKRRDFTVNALFMDPVTGVIHDFIGGKADLEKKIIRAVGDPLKRFQEDRLRILRAVRFYSQLGFSIEDNTKAALITMAKDLSAVSPERIEAEMSKLFIGPQLETALMLLEKSGIRQVLFPKLKTPDFKKITKAVGHLNQGDLVWLLFLGENESVMNEVMDHLHFSNKRKEEYLRAWSLQSKLKVFLLLPKSQQIRLANDPHIRIAAELGQILGNVTAEALAALQKAPPLPEPFLTGQDLIQSGMKPGPLLGRLLEEMYDLQLESQIPNKTAAIEILKKKFKKP